MTTQARTAGRAQFGTLDARPPQTRALDALGQAVPALEAALGFPVSVTAQAQPDGSIWTEVYIPDEHYNFQNATAISQAFMDAGRPFQVDIYTEVDSDIGRHEQ